MGIDILRGQVMTQPVTPHPDELDKILRDFDFAGRSDNRYLAASPALDKAKAAITKLRLQDKIDLLQRLMDDFEWETTRFIQLELIMLEFKTLKASEEKK